MVMMALASTGFLGTAVQGKAAKASCSRKQVSVRATAAPAVKLNTKRSEEVRVGDGRAVRPASGPGRGVGG